MTVYRLLTLPLPSRAMSDLTPARIIVLVSILLAAGAASGCGGGRAARAVSHTTTGAVRPAADDTSGVVGLAEEQDRDF